MSITLQPEDLWLTTLRAVGRSDNTISLYRFAVRKFSDWRVHGISPANDVNTVRVTSVTSNANTDLLTTTRFEALAYTRYLTDAYKPNGVKTHIKSLRSFFSWCMNEEMINANPFMRITITIPDEPQRTADGDQVERMLASAKRSRRDTAICTLLADSGARRGEVAAITIADLDLHSGVITLRESKSRARIIPISNRTLIALSRWLRERGVGQGSLWYSPTHVGVNAYALVAEVVERHSKGALTCHSLRRRFAIEWMLKGGSETSLMRHCGWSSRTMIAVYSRASSDVIAANEYRNLFG
jgi:integrase